MRICLLLSITKMTTGFLKVIFPTGIIICRNTIIEMNVGMLGCFYVDAAYITLVLSENETNLIISTSVKNALQTVKIVIERLQQVRCREIVELMLSLSQNTSKAFHHANNSTQMFPSG